MLSTLTVDIQTVQIKAALLKALCKLLQWCDSHPPPWNKIKSQGEIWAGAVKPCLTVIGKKGVLDIPKDASAY